MQNHARVLQQRVQVAAVGRWRVQSHERVGREQQIGQKKEGQKAQDAHHTGMQVGGQLAALPGHCNGPARKQKRPQQKRTLMRAPGGRDAVLERQVARRVVGHVHDGEVVDHERPRQCQKADQHAQQLPNGCAACHGHPARVVTPGTSQAEEALEQGQLKGNDQGRVAKFRDHGSTGKTPKRQGRG